MDYTIRQMTMGDYDEAYRLWTTADGICLDEEDRLEGIARYLLRNQGLCFVAIADDRLAGTVLCGHEGRRGILRHLVVAPEFRGNGIARELISRCRAALAREGIRKCNTFVLDSNTAGRQFWRHVGWHLLDDDFRVMQMPTEPDRGPER